MQRRRDRRVAGLAPRYFRIAPQHSIKSHSSLLARLFNVIARGAARFSITLFNCTRNLILNLFLLLCGQGHGLLALLEAGCTRRSLNGLTLLGLVHSQHGIGIGITPVARCFEPDVRQNLRSSAAAVVRWSRRRRHKGRIASIAVTRGFTWSWLYTVIAFCVQQRIHLALHRALVGAVAHVPFCVHLAQERVQLGSLRLLTSVFVRRTSSSRSGCGCGVGSGFCI